MKKILLSIFTVSFLLFGCSEDIMDDINKDRNNAPDLEARNMLPTIILKTAVETYAHDIAWYASVYIEHSVGTWGQHYTADRRTNSNEASLFNNSWNRLYSVMMITKDIIEKTSEDGPEFDNPALLGMAQVIMATNLATLTDMWNRAPWTEALMGAALRQPKYDKQKDIYADVFALLAEARVNLGKPIVAAIANQAKPFDLLYGSAADAATQRARWIKLSYSLEARYRLRLANRYPEYLDLAIDAANNGFAAAAEQALFNHYGTTTTKINPWWEFDYGRAHLAASKTIFDLMDERNDPRINAYFLKEGGAFVPAEPGNSVQTQGGVYSKSRLTAIGINAPTPIMTYHELLYVKAEAMARKSQDFAPVLKAAIAANFAWHKVTANVDTFYMDNVEPRLGTTVEDQVKEIVTQKYIGLYEFEAIEAYNDYRRTGIPTMKNPFNNLAAYGFVNMFPYPVSEVSNNSANVPSINVFQNKVWWAGGDE